MAARRRFGPGLCGLEERLLLSGSPTPASLTAVAPQVEAASAQPLPVAAQPTTTTVTASNASPVYGQPVSFTATVTAGSNTPAPTGTVQFQIDGVNFGDAVPLVNGQATSRADDSLDLGNHAVTAVYVNADDQFAPSRGSLSQGVTVSVTPTQASLSFDPYPIYGEPLTFTANVSAALPSTATPVGTVQFYTDGKALGSPVPLVNGAATSPGYTIQDLNPFAVSAQFTSTDRHFLNSQAEETGVKVRIAPTTTTLTSSSETAVSGQPVTFTAKVVANPRSTASTDGNTVTFVDGPNVLGSAVVTHGVAMLTVPSLAPGSHNVVAVFAGDADIGASASTGTITSVAGTNSPGNDGPATAASLVYPSSVVVDGSGNAYFIDQSRLVVREVVKATGDIVTVAGNGSRASYDDGDGGPATAAAFGYPMALAIDSAGDLFVADEFLGRVREVVKATGNIITIAGTGIPRDSGEGVPAVDAQVRPTGLAVDAAGDVFIAETYNNRVREVVKATGDIITVAGNGTAGFSGDGGPAVEAQLNGPTALAVDAAGNLYIADVNNNRVRELVKATGQILTIAGGGQHAPGVGVAPTDVAIGQLGPIAFDSAGDLFIADDGNASILELRKSSGDLVKSLGGHSGFSGDGGPAAAAEIGNSQGLAVDSAGNLFIADTVNGRIREVVNATGQIITIAGNGNQDFSGDGGPATSAEIGYDQGIAIDAAGNLYVSGFNRIREVIKSTGQIVTIAGNGTFGYSGDGGPAVDAMLANPMGLAVDSAGNVYIADSGNDRLREVVKSTGQIVTLVGAGATNPGLTRSAGPQGLAFDSSGNLYIADLAGLILELEKSTGTLVTIAGGGAGNVVGPATQALLSSPQRLAVDTAGDVFFTQYNDNSVYEVEKTSGQILRLAGNGTAGDFGDSGPATSAELNRPMGLAVDSAGDVLIADTQNNKVREVLKATGQMITVAGNGDFNVSGDGGPATEAALFAPYDVAVDGAGNVYIADTANHRVREVTPSDVVTVTQPDAFISVGVSSPAPVYGQPVTFTATATAASSNAPPPSGTVQFQIDGIDFGSPVPLVDGKATSAPDTAMAVGSHQVEAVLADRTASTGSLTGGLTVAPASTSATLTSSRPSATYGQALQFTATVSAAALSVATPSGTVAFYDGTTLLDSETLDAAGDATSRAVTLPAGTHSIVAVFTPDGTGFGVSRSSTLDQSVAKAPLTITANSLAKVYGSAMPGLTASYSGFVAGDSPASLTTPVVLTTSALASSHVGSYPIVPSGASDGNYAITFASGTLTVIPAPLQIIANNQTMAFGSAPPALTVRYVGFVNGDTPASLSTPPQVSTSATAQSPAGTYPITVSGATSPDYRITEVPGTLTVEPAVSSPHLNLRELILDLEELFREAMHGRRARGQMPGWLKELAVIDQELRVVLNSELTPVRPTHGQQHRRS